ncbi:hypothetical protein HCN44_004326 [Aphidius gifuensis]|uniref:DnaJ homolog l(2)tid, mitochondrial n=2 Tax=Aphidius gifuensis TaxID=684658 RepID=A0A834Y0N9_APHGI|nr:hypothetical protein HCN44_004326 [Aphidius gifuensis]
MATGKTIASIFRSRNLLIIGNSKSGFIKTNAPRQCDGCRRQFVTLTVGAGASSSYSNDKYIKKIQTINRQFHVSNSLSAPKKSYYDILGVARNSSSKDIKKAYYQLAKKYHPDTNKDDPDARKKFQEVSEAYEVLSDDTKKKEYDTWGATSEQMGMGGGGGGGGYNAGKAEGYTHNWNFQTAVNPEELFRKIFGEHGFKTADYEDYADSKYGFGTAQELIMNLTFGQAARGVNKEISLNVVDTCPKCQGSRAELGTKAIKCHQCNGTGAETISTGPFVMRSTCRSCHGSRVYIKFPCIECEGKGQSVQRKKVIVPVPAGVEDGQTIRIAVGNKEVFVTFRVEKSRYFKRDGADIHTDAEISLAQAALGGTIRVKGVYEDHTVVIKPGTASHNKIRLNGKGMKKVNTIGHGDHYVNIKITVPTYLTDKQKALLMAYAELEKNTPGTIDGVTTKTDGTKECYDGPLELLKLIRQALSDIPLPTSEDLKKSIPDGPGDIPQTNKPSSESSKDQIEKKEDNDMKMKQKIN